MRPADFDQCPVQISDGEVVQNLVLIHHQKFKGAGPVGAHVVVGGKGRGFVCHGLGVQVFVNLFGFGKVLDTFLVLAGIVVEHAFVKVVKEGALFAVNVVFLLFDFGDGAFEAFFFEYGRKGLVTGKRLVRTGTKQQR